LEGINRADTAALFHLGTLRPSKVWRDCFLSFAQINNNGEPWRERNDRKGTGWRAIPKP